MNWSGYEPVAVIKMEPEELASRHGLVFREAYDDLDTLRETTFLGPSGETFGLIRHTHAPKPGTQLLVKARSLSEAADLLDKAVETLDLSKSDLSWVRPELKATIATTKRVAQRKTSGKARSPKRRR